MEPEHQLTGSQSATASQETSTRRAPPDNGTEPPSVGDLPGQSPEESMEPRKNSRGQSQGNSYALSTSSSEKETGLLAQHPLKAWKNSEGTYRGTSVAHGDTKHQPSSTISILPVDDNNVSYYSKATRIHKSVQRWPDESAAAVPACAGAINKVFSRPYPCTKCVRRV